MAAEPTRERRRARARSAGEVAGQLVAESFLNREEGECSALSPLAWRTLLLEAQWRLYVRREYGAEYQAFMAAAEEHL